MNYTTSLLDDNVDWLTELNNEILYNNTETVGTSYIHTTNMEYNDISHNLYITPNVSFRYNNNSLYRNDFIPPP